MRTSRYHRTTTARPVERVWTEADEIAWRERFTAQLRSASVEGRCYLDI